MPHRTNGFLAVFGQKTSQRQTLRRCRLSLELLEDRTVPTTWTWTGLGDGNWSDDDNWRNDLGQIGVPVAGDSVKFTGAYNVNSTLDPGFAPSSIAQVTMEAGYSQQLTLQKDITVTTTTQWAGTVFGSYSYTVPAGGLYEWLGGTLRGFGSPTSYNTIVQGTMIINSVFVTLDGRNLQDYGTVNWIYANGATNVIDVKNSGKINVKSGGLFASPGGGTFEVKDDGSGRVNNEGELRNDAGTDITFKGVVETYNASAWNVDGDVHCDGNVQAAAGSTLTIAALASVEFNANATFNAGANVFGPGTAFVVGTFYVTGGNLNMKAVLNLTATGTISIDGTLSVTGGGSLAVNGGVIQGTTMGDQCQIAAGGSMNIFATVTLIGVSVVNGNTLGWGGGNITLQNLNDTAKITNNSVFAITSDGTIAGTGILTNNATIDVLPQPPATPTILCQFDNLGVINLLQSTLVVGHDWTMPVPGRLSFDGGNFQVNGTFNLQGTIRVPQSGFLLADLVLNNGIIDLRNGLTQSLNITTRVGVMNGGNYTQGAGGSLFLEILGDGACDVLVVAQQATLAGVLDISLGGGYQPAGQNPRTWIFLTYSGRNGTFGTVNRPPNFGMPVYQMINATITWTPPG